MCIKLLIIVSDHMLWLVEFFTYIVCVSSFRRLMEDDVFSWEFEGVIRSQCFNDKEDAFSCEFLCLDFVCRRRPKEPTHQPEFLALKHERRILRHSSSPWCGLSMMEQVRLCAVWPMENWLGLSLNQIQGWTTVRESYSRALEQGPLPPTTNPSPLPFLCSVGFRPPCNKRAPRRLPSSLPPFQTSPSSPIGVCCNALHSRPLHPMASLVNIILTFLLQHLK